MYHENMTEQKTQIRVFEVGNTVVELRVNDEMALVKKTKYPLAGYSNRYGRYIIAYPDPGVVKVVAFCDTWAVPPCRGLSDTVTELRIEDRELAKTIYDEISRFISLTTDDSDEKAVVFLRRLADLVEQNYNRMVEEVNVQFERFVDLLYEIETTKSHSEEVKEALADAIEKLKKMTPEEFLTKFHNCFRSDS